MSDAQTNTDGVPEWDLADRMRKALRNADIGVGEMAEYLGVKRGTVSTWINGRIAPSVQTLRLFSMRCGVPLDWLRYGSDQGPNTPSGQGFSGIGCIEDSLDAADVMILKIAA